MTAGMTASEAGQRIDPIQAERARFFALVARLLAAAPDAALLARLAALPGGASPVVAALAALAEAARATDEAAAGREYAALFVGVARGELQPYASYYLTGFLHDRPLAALRGDLARLGIARAPGVAEPEDHIAFLCETMAGLHEGRFAAPADAADEFFALHLAPWAGRFFADLERAEAARFYRAVGALGATAICIEQDAAALPA